MKSNHFYVTTPIYYGTAKPHLGSLYSTLLADVIYRWQQLLGRKTYFLTGTDEHGQKIADAAEKVGMDPKAFVDSFVVAYKDAWKRYDIDYTKFIRTTDPEHVRGVQALVEKLCAQDDIYKDLYHGWYCTPCETFEASYEGDAVLDAHVVGPVCSSCARQTVLISEETYFFKLSAYQGRLIEWYASNPNLMIPRERMNEVTSFVKSGLKDLSISRSTVSWGVPFPDDSKQTVYVWVDALCNYITALGYGDPAKENEFDEWWPAQLHVLGKDIVRFHAVYWPALLMAAELPLPKQLLVHGWIQINKEKMSKSKGNAVDPLVLADTYGDEAVRYYLMRQIPVNMDGEFSIADLEQRITSDLANDLGNLLNRMVSLAHKNGVHMVAAPNVWNHEALMLRSQATTMLEDYAVHMNEYQLHTALAGLWKFINKTNAYFHSQEPWKVARKDMALFEQIISATCHSLYVIAIAAWPIMPKKMEALLGSLGHTFDLAHDAIEHVLADPWMTQFDLKKIEPLFEKFDTKKEQKVEDVAKVVAKVEEPKKQDDYITIEDVAKVDLRVGTIVEAQSIPDSAKLIKMQVDFGDLGKRQILGGIKKWYHPEDLVGKQGLFICNLKPRKMMGIESQGMMLLAEGQDGKMHIVNPEGLVEVGTRLR